MIPFSVGLLVDLIPFLAICMCPIVVNIDSGRCFHTALLVRPGYEVNQSLLMALHHSVFTGRDPIIALRYAINFATVG